MERAPDDWWRTYFEGAATEVFRRVFAAKAPADAATIEKVLALTSPCRVLDVPCGHGRIAIELAARGHTVTGLDFSSSEIARAQGTARERGLEVDFRLGDMRRDIPPGAFDAAACFGHSFGYFDDDDDNLGFLRAVYGALRPGGGFAMENAFCMESYLPRASERPSWSRVDQFYLLQRETFDPERGRLDIEHTYVTPETGGVDVRRVSCRMYTYREIVSLLRSSGFEDVRGLDAAGDAPFRVGGHLLIVARRPS
ncbi:MAG TPA: class I SAM-dependent methyltransferase [Polyangiaceae bacterium]|jgi:SAM-dependent methyltransferase